MSLVIAVKHNDKIYLGCDSQVTCGQSKESLPAKHGKIFNLKCPSSFNVLCGGVGNLRDLQIISVEDDLIDKIILYEDRLDYEYIVKTLFSKIYTTLVNYNRVNKENNELVNYINDEIIIAYKDNAWLIRQDGCVMEIDDYLICGSGSEIAKGVLEKTQKETDPIKRIHEAIKSAAHLTLYVDENIVISST